MSNTVQLWPGMWWDCPSCDHRNHEVLPIVDPDTKEIVEFDEVLKSIEEATDKLSNGDDAVKMPPIVTQMPRDVICCRCFTSFPINIG